MGAKERRGIFMGGVEWTPADSINTYLWLPADQETGLNDGDNVNTLTDQSGNSLDFDATGHAPTYETNEVNGLPVYRFDGTAYARAALAGDWKFMHDGTDFFVLVVCLTPVLNPDTRYMLINNNAASSASIGYALFYEDRSFIPKNNSLTTQIAKGSSGNFVVGVSSADDTFPTQMPNIVTTDYVFNRTGDDMIVSVNDSLPDSGESLNLPHSSSNPSDIITIGARSTTFDSKAIMDMSEILIMKSPTEQEKVLALQYASNKYNI